MDVIDNFVNKLLYSLSMTSRISPTVLRLSVEVIHGPIGLKLHPPHVYQLFSGSFVCFEMRMELTENCLVRRAPIVNFTQKTFFLVVHFTFMIDLGVASAMC